MTEAAESGVLHRHGARVEGIDFHDPAETVRLVRLLVDIETVLKLPPSLPEAGNAIARITLGLVAAESLRPGSTRHAMVRPEVAVEILLRSEVGAPGRFSAGTIVERAENGFA